MFRAIKIFCFPGLTSESLTTGNQFNLLFHFDYLQTRKKLWLKPGLVANDEWCDVFRDPSEGNQHHWAWRLEQTTKVSRQWRFGFVNSLQIFCIRFQPSVVQNLLRDQNFISEQMQAKYKQAIYAQSVYPTVEWENKLVTRVNTSISCLQRMRR